MPTHMETMLYLRLLRCSAWMAVVHLVTAERPLFPGRMFADANFIASLIFMFLIGCVMTSCCASRLWMEYNPPPCAN